MKVSETTASHLCMFTSMAEVLSGFLGGDDGGKGPITEDLSKLSPEEFAARMNAKMAM